MLQFDFNFTLDRYFKARLTLNPSSTRIVTFSSPSTSICNLNFNLHLDLNQYFNHNCNPNLFTVGDLNLIVNTNLDLCS